MRTLFNPIFRYLHPRASGLIAYGGGGGGGESGATAAQVDASVGGGVTAVNANTNAGFASNKTFNQGLADGLNTKIGGVQGSVDGLGSNVTGGFDSLNTYLQDQFGASATDRVNQASATRKLVQEVDGRNQTSFGQLGQNLNTVGDDVTQGFADQTTRFDTLDDSVGGVQTTADNIQTDVGSVQNAVDNSAIDNEKAFKAAKGQLTTLSEDSQKAFGDAQTNRETNQGILTQNQLDLDTNLNTLSDNQDTYYGDLSETADNIEGVQDTFKSNFDAYVTKYGTDTKTTDENIGRIETGLGDFAEEFRGNLQDIEGNTSDSETSLDDISTDLTALEGTVEGGFSAANTAMGTNNTSLIDAIGKAGDDSAVTGLLTTLGENVGNLSSTFLEEFGGLASAFTTTGDLIKDEIMENGDVIQRTLNDQGTLIESRFDAQGNLIGTTETNINDAIAAAQAELSTGQQGLMTEMDATRQTQFDEMATQIASGFDDQTGQMDTQVSSLAGLASQMTDLDMDMRQEFFQMEGAFDDTGALIRQEVTDTGITIQRNIDQNGNLMIQKFDQQGLAIGNKVFNINEALAKLAGIDTLPGASVSMGNLSPALQASPNGETNVPTGGFMAPFTATV
jgi:hypothetical protein